MQLYNTLTRQIEPVIALDSKTVRIYSCGPTVYDHIHIGNLSSFIFADTLRRVSNLQDGEVKHVMNFTDVDDKTIRRSQEKYSDLDPMEALLKLTSEYSDIFLKDMELVGNDISVMTFIKATDSIQAMQELILELLHKGFAYKTEDGIYFSIEAYKKSGKTYGQLTEINAASTSEARINNDEYDKDSAHDFALWKHQKPGEPAWDFLIGDENMAGRPGWHIECSAMSSGQLGQPFDIHTGGIDLIFPHHENEIAQSTAAKEDPIYAKHFAHNEHLLVDNQKMSKSLNNFYTLKNITEKGFDPLAFRLLVLQSHYRKQAHFSWDNLEAAQNRLNDLRAWADLRYQPSTDVAPKELDELFKTTREGIQKALEDDLDTPTALAILSKLVNYMSSTDIPEQEGKYTDGMLAFLDSVFSLGLSNRPDISEDQERLIQERENARQSKDWQKSDELRDKLIEQGINVRDTASGPIWSRV